MHFARGLPYLYSLAESEKCFPEQVAEDGGGERDGFETGFATELADDGGGAVHLESVRNMI